MHLCSSCVRKREDWLACYTALSSQKALKSKFSIVFVFDKYDLNSLKCIESRIKLGQNIYYIFAFFSAPYLSKCLIRIDFILSDESYPRLQKDMQNESRNPLIDVEDLVR